MDIKRIALIGVIIVFLVLSTLTFLNLIYMPQEPKMGESKINPIEKIQGFDFENALIFSKKICSLGPRYGGNKAELNAAEFMEGELKKSGLDVRKEKVDLGNGKYTYNVIGEIKGTKYPDRYIILGSHIDSPGFCEGATDDAAAMGIQVEVAKIISENFKPEKTILIIGFGGEELWFKGSEDFVKKHPNIVKNCDAMIDLNCVGAGDNIFLTSYSYQPQPVEGDPNLIKVLGDSATKLNHPVEIGETTYPSDTYPFYSNKIRRVPVCQVMSQPFEVSPWSAENTADKLDINDIEKIGETVTLAIVNLTSAKPAMVKAAEVADSPTLVDNECCCVIAHLSPGHDILAYRRDSPKPAEIIIEKGTWYGKKILHQYKEDSYFTHVIITEDGWIICIGGNDDPQVNKELEKLGNDMISNGITDAKLKKVEGFLKDVRWGHFLIKSPNNTIGLAVYDYRASYGIRDISRIRDKEFVKVTNNPGFYEHNTLSDTRDPLNTTLWIIGTDTYGLNRRDVTIYDLNKNNSTKLRVWVSYDNGILSGSYPTPPDDVKFMDTMIIGEQIPPIPHRRFLGEVYLQGPPLYDIMGIPRPKILGFMDPYPNYHKDFEDLLKVCGVQSPTPLRLDHDQIGAFTRMRKVSFHITPEIGL